MAKQKKTPPDITPADVVKPEKQPVTVDVDSFSDVVSPSQAAVLFGESKTASKPDISRLPAALDPFGQPMFGVGDKIVIERYATILAGHPYLDTKTYRVLEMDADTGNVKLYDDFLNQFATDNWKTGPKAGNVYKFAIGHLVTRKKRGRPRKLAVGEEKPVVVGPDGKPVKKKRGRPPGVKNRPREEVAAAKAAKRAVMAAKKAGR